MLRGAHGCSSVEFALLGAFGGVPAVACLCSPCPSCESQGESVLLARFSLVGGQLQNKDFRRIYEVLFADR